MSGGRLRGIWGGLGGLLLATALMLTSCSTGGDGSDRVKVVVSILPLAEFVENVGREKVSVTVMVPPGASPHTYEPSPSQLVEVSQARMFVKAGSGVGFELAWMDKIIGVNKRMLVVDSSRGIGLRKMEPHHGRARDPHIWLSPLNARIMVQNICEGLIQVDPGNKDRYLQNKEGYIRKLEALDKDIREGLSGIESRRFMVFHPAWGYFAAEYDLIQMPIEIEGKEPSPQDMAKLIKQAKENGIKAVFASPQFNPQSAQAIAREIGGRVVLIDPLAKDYIANLRLVLSKLVQAMR
ncbi:MAG TPA: zinc ABC transporter solute-binding protein [Dehalococcoidia bacterium]|nr:zinc ABC transporter solute-binding protein [Dehalococcoidia bacterium]